MSVELNHTIIPAKDKWVSAKFLADILNLEAGPEWGHFVPVRTANGVTLDFDSREDFRGLCLSHPNVIPLLVTRPPGTPLGLRPIGTLRPLEQVLALLIDAGFPPVTALRVYRAYFALLYGYVLNELQETVNDPEESKDLLRLGLRRLRASDFVHIRALETELGRYDGAEELAIGLDILLTGIDHTLNNVPDRTPPTRNPSGTIRSPAT